MDSAYRDFSDPQSRRQTQIPCRYRARCRRIRERYPSRKGCSRFAKRAAMSNGRSFREVFGIDSVVSGRAPGRVNLLGDHTDYNDGFVLPTIIPQQTVVEAAPGNGIHEVYSATLDRMACSLGRTDRMLFLDTMTLERSLLPLPAASELLVMHSGVPRSLAGSNYNRRRAECEAAAAMLGVRSLRMIDDLGAVDRLPSPLRERARHVVTENRRVQAAINADAAAFGALMTQSHVSLRDDYAVSIPAMDALLATLQHEPGVFGARLTGAGFGGCCVALMRQGTAAATGYRVASCFGELPSVIVPSRC